MNIEILCTPRISRADATALDAYGKEHGMTRAEVIRLAVSRFSSVCVPTHGRKTKGRV